MKENTGNNYIRDINDKSAMDMDKISYSSLYSIINQSPYSICISDDKGTLIWTNKACLDLLNISEDEVVGKYNIFQDDIVASQGLLPLVRSVFESGESVRFELKYDSSKLKNPGLQRFVNLTLDVTIFPIKDSTGKITNAVIQHMDITEGKRAEIFLRASEDRFRRLVKSVSDYIYTFEIEPDGRTITSHGPGCVNVTGYTSEEYAADPYLWIRMVHEEDRNAVSEQAAKLLKGEDAPSLEHRIIHKNGTVRWVKNVPVIRHDDHEHFAAYDGLISDITERKLAEKALRLSEEKYREMFERAVEGMFQCTVQGEFINVNPYFAAMSGYESAHELVSTIKSIAKEMFVNIDDSRRFIKLLNDNGTISGFEHEIYKKDMSRIWVSTNARIVHGPNDEVMYFEGTTVNITERKQSEEEKEKLQSQLRQSQKMEAIGTFIGGVAHDFNNILSVLLGYATLMQMDLEINHPLRPYLDQIMSSSEKAANLTRSLLAFSRKQPIDLKPINLNEIINGTEILLKRLLTEDIVLNKILTEDETTIMGEVTQINQILFNLATNARDAMPKGGIITIETVTTNMDKDFTDILGYGKPGKYIMLTFTDTGTGYR